MTPLPLLHQREIEAGVIAPLFHAFAAEVGEARAREIVGAVVRELATRAGCAAAAGGNDLAHLKQAVAKWTEGGALELTVLRDDGDAFEFDVTRCRFAEMYTRLGLADLGGLLSCARDAAMIEGFNPGVAFQRTQTIMGGASHCDFRYRKK
ncbi:L-2-amino-thiazoline-4-carboxylic acid hydrolase [Frigoriglobus tundricola]|uniref:L-2-amino-thiazoline-4-carboxylic acid hydrolase n=1 Tax=Frigoriglobus tundricola TaxID=2774151 RepID=A0A6M5YYS4_9BACT|nr:L-2-amino-thiazoline-4-carboxylic acid hydrolase [Frigoriglobus tundricola]QJW99179.1 L-2-amino-thiazoline-4-carboxylic acid hydrolase [Frigoriglobus tundricola]